MADNKKTAMNKKETRQNHIENSLQKREGISVLGAALVDVLAGVVNPVLDFNRSQPMEMIRMSTGGDALNQSLFLHRLGADVHLASKTGRDLAGTFLLDFMQKEGMDTSQILCDPDTPTAINIVLIGPDAQRTFLTDPKSTLRNLSLTDLPAVKDLQPIVSFASLFVSPLLRPDLLAGYFKEIAMAQKTLVVDTTSAKNGEKLEDLKDLFPYISVFVPNEAELGLLAPEMSTRQAAKACLDMGVKCVIVKQGSKGALLAWDQKMVQIPAYPTKAADSTGAGDAFAAGLLYGLSQKKDMLECACLGSALASMAVETIGTQSVLADKKEMEKRAKSIRSWIRAHESI